MNNETHVYLGTRPCGCHVAACVDMPDNKKVTANAVQQMIEQGAAVSRRALSDFPGGTVKIHRCVHEQQGRVCQLGIPLDATEMAQDQRTWQKMSYR